MIFRIHIAFLSCALALISSCSGGKSNFIGNKAKIGIDPESFVTSFSTSQNSGVADSKVVLIANDGKELWQFAFRPFAFEKKIKLPKKMRADAVIPGPEGRYFIAIGKDRFAIIAANREVNLDPVEFIGTIVGVSFDAKTHRLAIQDNLGAVGLLSLNEDGDIKDSWTGGPVLSDDASIVAGTLLEEGPLVLTFTNENVAIVDFEKSIAKREWKFHQFPLAEASQLEWLTPVRGNNHLVFARGNERIILFDIVSESIVDEVTFSNPEQAWHFSQRVGHVVTVADSESDFTVYTATKDGTIDQKLVRSVLLRRSISRGNVDISSRLDLDLNRLTLSMRPMYGEQIFAHYNYNDSLALAEHFIDSQAKVAVSSEYSFVLYDSELGYAERWKVAKDPEPAVLKNFNLKYIAR